MTGKTQSYARQLNNQLIMRELRQGCCSATMLSQKLNLSNAALSTIISKLQRDGYIKQADIDAEVNIGRKPVYYTINEKFGYIVVVSLTDYVAKVVVSDMKMNVVDSAETKVERYDVKMLYELVLTVTRLLSQEKYRESKLLGIDLSIPGRVNRITGELQLSPQFDKDIFKEKNGIVNLFKRQFGSPVVMTNDINLAALGEMYNGTMKGIDNGMLVHVDEGIGGALILEGKLYTGTQGFSGEVGLMRTEFRGEQNYLDEFVSLRAIKKALGIRHTKEVVERYVKEEEVRRYVNETAECLGKELKDIVELLNITKIALSGRIKGFGEEYIEIVRREVGESQNVCEVEYTKLEDASVVGAISKAVEALTDDIFE